LLRIEVTFSITLIAVCIVIWIGRRVKAKEQAAARQAQVNHEHAKSKLIEQKSDGVFYVYIAWWRYLVLEMAFALMLYVLITEFISIYKELPHGFLHHWNKDATIVLIGAAGIVMIAAYLIKLIRRGYKDVQMEIGKDYVRFRIPGIRGGMMLSDQYITLNYSEIQEISFRQAAPLIGYVLILKTATKTHNINLILPPAEKIASYRILDQATSDWQQRNKKQVR
jgi:hypothetical protein